jgi:acetyl-CoA decarbonylase/synthase complex subunit gamma
MVVEQEMAEIYPPTADDLSEFLPETDCGGCGYESCIAFAEAVLANQQSAGQCSEIDPEQVQLIERMVGLKKDPIPYNIMMEQESCELIEINGPDTDSPLLITCNFCETVAIMKYILEETGTRAFLLPTYTHGYSVDNAVHERMFKALEVWKAIQDSSASEKISKTRMVIPGLAESERSAIRQLTRWEVLVGPASGFLTPLFLWENGLWP